MHNKYAKPVRYIIEPCHDINYVTLTIKYHDDNHNLVNKLIGMYLNLSTALKKAKKDFERRFKDNNHYEFISVCKSYKLCNYYVRDVSKDAFNENC